MLQVHRGSHVSIARDKLLPFQNLHTPEKVTPVTSMLHKLEQTLPQRTNLNTNWSKPYPKNKPETPNDRERQNSPGPGKPKFGGDLWPAVVQWVSCRSWRPHRRGHQLKRKIFRNMLDTHSVIQRLGRRSFFLSLCLTPTLCARRLHSCESDQTDLLRTANNAGE